MKKSIVLFISLLFISALSLLIVQNLDDTNTYIEEQNIKLNKIQVLSLFSSAKDAAFDVIKNHGNDLEEEISIIIPIRDININLMLSKYDKPDINSVNDSNTENEKLKNIFLDNDINDFYLFKEIFDDKKKNFSITVNKKQEFEINNNKQINAIMQTYFKDSYSRNKYMIKDKIGFFQEDPNNIFYELTLSINYLNNTSKAYYILDKTKVKYFEISFK